ncbi:nucleoside recognition protein [Clostridium sp. PL3]|uniref:Nucleoside recognition protein n=1 Tax=Clostridium thailandense TaxID=2794346 RepID=A0A949TFW2_9CLOT|nr:nucleoside recognition domain-containing protein [Clostridium thailandense]MBV7271440.1 nucleoside recognition protein [Clostridium thailandense]
MQSNVQQNSNNLAAKKNIIETFMAGAKKGFYIGVELITPAMILGYAIIQFLQITGLLDIVGKLLNPVMMVFGLPGKASVALIAAFFAKTAGAAAAATLYTNGAINAVQATILFPATILMGTLVGHYVRIVIVANTNKKWHPLLIAVPIIDAVIAMLITRAILSFM